MEATKDIFPFAKLHVFCTLAASRKLFFKNVSDPKTDFNFLSVELVNF